MIIHIFTIILYIFYQIFFIVLSHSIIIFFGYFSSNWKFNIHIGFPDINPNAI